MHDRSQPIRTDDAPIVIRNPMRFWVPLITAALMVVMFAPPFALGWRDRGATWPAIAGVAFFAICAAWFARSAWRAPIELTFADGLTIRRPRRSDRHAGDDVKRWTFALPEGPPTQGAPGTNALLILSLRDGTHFRGEVTSDEGRAIAAWFRRHAPRVTA